jgi:outer membrane lipoprotein-sorting protein
MTNSRQLLPFGVAAVAIVGLLFAGNGNAADLEEILAGFDEVQSSIHSLRAEFHETSTNLLLKDPIVAEGRFYLSKPDAIRWEYRAPEEMRFVIADDQYTGYFPTQKRAEKRSVRRWSEQIFRFFGLGQGSAELSKFYDISLGGDGSAQDGTYLLLLEPKKRRVKKRVETVRFWLDAKSFLPRRVEYLSKDGSTREILFRDVQVNPDLAAGIFTVQIPSDVTVTQGFGGLPSISPGSAR